jgi:hypothetical protein
LNGSAFASRSPGIDFIQQELTQYLLVKKINEMELPGGQ